MFLFQQILHTLRYIHLDIHFNWKVQEALTGRGKYEMKFRYLNRGVGAPVMHLLNLSNPGIIVSM